MSTDSLETPSRNSPVWCAKEDLLRSTPCVGPVLSTSMSAQLSELGSLNRKKIAALVGVAPFASDSGRFHGQAHHLGWARTRTLGALHGRPGRCASQSRPSRVLLQTPSRREGTQGRPGRLHAQVAHDPQCHGSHQHLLEGILISCLTFKTVALPLEGRGGFSVSPCLRGQPDPMPRDPSIRSVLVIGSGPIVIGQACEFDYAGHAGDQGAQSRGHSGGSRELSIRRRS